MVEKLLGTAGGAVTKCGGYKSSVPGMAERGSRCIEFVFKVIVFNVQWLLF